MNKELRTKTNRAINYYITTDRIQGERENVLNHIANTHLMNLELMKTFHINQKEVDEEVERIVDDILETYGGIE